MKKNTFKAALASVLLASTISGCNYNTEVENAPIVTDIDEEKFKEVKEEIEEIVKEEEQPVIEEKYNMQDLYVLCVPKDNIGEFFILNKVSETEEDSMYHFISSDFDASFPKNLITSNAEWWIPNCDVYSITPLKENAYIKENFSEDMKLTKNEVANLEAIFWSINESSYDREHTYDINKLLMVNAEGNYSMYSTERYLGYLSSEGNPVVYLYDVCNYKNGLRFKLEQTGHDYLDPIDLSDEGGNILDMSITSIDSDYAASMKDKEKEVMAGGIWYKGTFGKYDVQVNKFAKYVTLEQLQRGYLTQDEVETIVSELNKENTYTK